MKRRIVSLAFLLMMAFTLPVKAQGIAESLKSGDTLSVVVSGEQGLTTRKAIVTNGKVDLPLLGKVQAEGLSIREFAWLVQGGYSKHVNAPKITVILHFF